MTKADLVAGVLWIGVTLYAVFGGADFGAGFWDLVAGSPERGEKPRAQIEHSLGPVWEANHVWLIFVLVVLWAAFSEAFAAVMTTLYMPLALAAVGIVLRGSGFAFRKSVRSLRARQLSGAAFAASSVVTPFFMGTVVGAVASGRVPANGDGDPITSWLNAPSLLIGAMFVAAGAYLAAIFLIADSHKAGNEELARYFTRRAIGAAAFAGATALAGILVMKGDDRTLYDGLTSEALPLVILSGLCGLAVLGMLIRGIGRGLRPLAVAAVVAVVWGWGVAQFPYLLPGEETISAGASPGPTLTAVLIIFGAAVLLVLPSLGLLYWLSQRRLLEDG
jgi:cytochrome bd ubiquinol oxidase subunit II